MSIEIRLLADTSIFGLCIPGLMIFSVDTIVIIRGWQVQRPTDSEWVEQEWDTF